MRRFPGPSIFPSADKQAGSTFSAAGGSGFVTYRAQRAACALAENTADTLPHPGELRSQQERCRFITQHPEQLAARYLSCDNGFLYDQAVKDHFFLPMELPEPPDDNTPVMSLRELLRLTAEQDPAMAVRIWAWCIRYFGPFLDYGCVDPAGETDDLSDLTTDIIWAFSSFPEEFRTGVIHLLAKRPEFFRALTDRAAGIPDGTEYLVFTAIAMKALPTARSLYQQTLSLDSATAAGKCSFTAGLFALCGAEPSPDPMTFFSRDLLPLLAQESDALRQYADGLHLRAARSIRKKNAASIRGEAWRSQYLSTARQAELDLEEYATEQDFLHALAARQALAARRRDPHREMFLCCCVSLPDSGLFRYFLADDDTLRVGDTVLVPAQGEKGRQLATVESIGWYSRRTIPCLAAETPYLIGRAEQD